MRMGWSRRAPLLPPEEGGVVRRRLPNRPMVDAWSRRGVWRTILEELRKDADLEWVMLDGAIARAHQHSAGGKGGEAAQVAIACIIVWLRLGAAGPLLLETNLDPINRGGAEDSQRIPEGESGF